MRNVLLTALVLSMSALNAAENGDAPANYGSLQAWGHGTPPSGPRLGSTCTPDTTNPVTPAWTGDSDDGLVGIPQFDSWSATNSLTVHLESGSSGAYLVLFVDADDNGSFSAAETYVYSPATLLTGNYVFSNIGIHATQPFTRNGLNKVAVRITAQEADWGYYVTNPNGYFYEGEVEDWLIDVQPPHFAVVSESLRDATQGFPYSAPIGAVNGVTPYQWSLVSGTLPTGLTLVQSGQDFLLSGTPIVSGSSALAVYALQLRVTDAMQAVTTRTLQLLVAPPPAQPPFFDDFSTDKGWRFGGTWARTLAVGASPPPTQGWDLRGYQACDPAQDSSPGSDNMMLTDTPAAQIPLFMPQAIYATSPKVNCSTLASVELRFRRWLSYGEYDYVSVQASGDGIYWTTVWEPDSSPIVNPTTQYMAADPAWTTVTLDITALCAGRPGAQVRFVLGYVDEQYKTGIGSPGFMGWNLDDVWIGSKPQTWTGGVNNFALSSPQQTTIGTQNYPIAYPGSTHAWSATLNNPGTSAATITSIEVGVTLDNSTASPFWLPWYLNSDGWFDAGPWTAMLPLALPAGASGVQFNGQFACTGLPSNFAMLLFHATLYVRGTLATGQPFVISGSLGYVHSQSAMTGLRVYEYQSGGTEVPNGAAAGGLRDFGSLSVGSIQWLNIVLKNTGSTPLTLGLPQLSGAGAAEFSINTVGYLTTLNSGATTYFSIRFAPVSPGLKAATVTFTHTALNTGSPFAFDVSGTGVAAAPVLRVHAGTLTGPLISNGSLALGALDFGGLAAGAGPTPPLEIWIENVGSLSLALGTPALSGAAVAQFTLDTSSFVATVGVAGSTHFVLCFNPGAGAAAGPCAATLSFSHNDSGTSNPFTFAVAGDVLPPPYPIMGVYEALPLGAAITPGAAPSGLRRFGFQDVAAGPTGSLAIYVTNAGGVSLVLGTPQLLGANPGDFVLDLSQFLSPLPAGQSAVMLVSFDPLAKGYKRATVSFTHNDSAVANPFTFDVDGTGQDPLGVTLLAATLPSGQAGMPYGPFAIPAQGGVAPYLFSVVGVLPPGMTLSASGMLAGTPDAGTFGSLTFRLQARDTQGGTDERDYSVQIAPPIGHITAGHEGGGGCSTGDAPWPAWLLLLAIAGLLARVARRRAA